MVGKGKGKLPLHKNPSPAFGPSDLRRQNSFHTFHHLFFSTVPPEKVSFPSTSFKLATALAVNVINVPDKQILW